MRTSTHRIACATPASQRIVRTDPVGTERFAPLLQEVAAGPFFAFVHYKEADVTGHESGAESAAYRESIISLDEQLQGLLDVLSFAGVLDDTSVLLTTDHGFSGIFHLSRDPENTDTWIAALNFALRDDGSVKLLDVTPTVLEYFEIETGAVEPPLEGASAAFVP